MRSQSMATVYSSLLVHIAKKTSLPGRVYYCVSTSPVIEVNRARHVRLSLRYKTASHVH